MNQVLIVEDETRLAELVADYLKQANFSVAVLAHGDGAVEWIRQHEPQMVILDLMLPGMDGLEICKRVRQFSNVPILITTARVDEIDRLLGLELGADDYLCKPYSPRELVLRVKAVLRRTASPFVPADNTTTARLQMNEARLEALMDDQSVSLTAVEFALLATLVRQPGRIFPRSALMTQIYSDHRVVSDRTIDSHVKKIRRKLSAIPGAEDFIHSVYGVGYRFEEPLVP